MEEAQVKELEITAASFPARATFITVHSQATLDRANEFLKGVKTYRKQVADLLDPGIKKLNEAKAELLSTKRKLDDPAKEAEEIVKPVITKYLAEQDELRQKEKEKLEQALEEKFEKAREIERLGDKNKAEEIRKAEISVAEALPPPVKAAGTFLTKHWTWEEEDLDKVPRKWWTLDRLAINKEVREKKGKTNIPGIRVFQKASSKTRI